MQAAVVFPFRGYEIYRPTRTRGGKKMAEKMAIEGEMLREKYVGLLVKRICKEIIFNLARLCSPVFQKNE